VRAVTNEEIAGMMLGEVPEDRRFYSAAGRVARSLSGPGLAPIGMSGRTFHCHSNDTMMNSGNSIKDVIGDEELFQDLKRNIGRVWAANPLMQGVGCVEFR
jgi:hypothetical protein